MTAEERNAQVSYAEKIAKLLRKANTSDSEQEAESLTAKAQALMIKYAITEELLAQAEGRHVQDVIVTETIKYNGIFHAALFDIGWAIVQANDCKGFIRKTPGRTVTTLTVVGFKSDVTNVKLLDASLQIQASTAMQRWYRTRDVTDYTPMMKAKMRRQFLFSFAQGLSAKLAAAKRAGVDAAVAEEATRTGDADTARKSTDLVLMSKTDRVQDWWDNKYGSTMRTVRRNYKSGGYDASTAGYRAGMSADLGDPRIGGSRREIER